MSDDAARALWERARLVLDQVIDLPPEEQPGAVEKACAGDAALRAEVEALLAAESSAGAFLATPALERAARLLDIEGPGQADGPPGTVDAAPAVPGYRLLRRIGEGGMGEVYLAERTDGHFEQQVALKLLRRAGPRRPAPALSP